MAKAFADQDWVQPEPEPDPWATPDTLFATVASMSALEDGAHMLAHGHKLVGEGAASPTPSGLQRTTSSTLHGEYAHQKVHVTGKQWERLNRRIFITGEETSELWYTLGAAPRCIAVFETKHAAHRFIGKLAAAKLACDNAASREEKVRVYERYKEAANWTEVDTSAALRATQYLVLEVLPAPADHTESFLHEDYHCGYILNDYSNAKSDVTPHLDWHRTGDANVATEWARMKHGMYMWMTDRGHVPESSSKVEWHSLSLQGDSSGFTKKDQQQEVCSRTPLPLERAAPWISGGLDTGFWRLPKIFATEDGGTVLKPMELTQYSTWGTPLAEMGVVGGAGLRLYFTLLLLLAFTFLALGLGSIPTLYVNSLGHNYDTTPTFTSVFFTGDVIQYTFGNRNVTIEDLDAGNVRELWVAVVLDVLLTAGLAALVIKMHSAKASFLRASDDAMISMGDYSVFVQPNRTLLNRLGWKSYGKSPADEARLVDSLKAYLEENVDALRINERVKVATIEERGPSGKTEERPAIWPVYDQDENITLWRKKMQACYMLEEAIAVFLRMCGEGDNEAAIKKAEKRMHARLDALCKIQDSLRDAVAQGYFAVGAFVTFEYAEDYESVLLWASQFEEGQDVARYPLFKPNEGAAPSKKNPNGVQLSVKSAPEPEVIVWEHLEYDKFDRACRGFFINMFSTVMLLLGIVCIVYFSVYKEALNWTQNCAHDGIGISSNGTFAATYTNVTDGGYSEGELTPYGAGRFYCDGLQTAAERPQAFAHYKASWDALAKANTGYSFPQLYKTGSGHRCIIGDDQDRCCGLSESNMSLSWREAADRGCQRNDNWELDAWADFKPTYEHVQMKTKLDYAVGHHFSREAACYACSCLYAGSTAGEDSTFAGDMPGGTPAFCTEFTKKAADAQLFAKFAVFVVVIVNQVVRQVLTIIVEYEKNHTLGAEQASVAYKVFVAQLFNTALLMLVLRLKMWDFNVEEYDLLFNGKWYAQVAGPLVMTMVIQFIVAPVNHVVQYVVGKVKRHFARNGIVTQNAFMRLYDSGQLQLAASYGEVLLALSVTLVYSTALPMLYWVAAFGFALKYWVDKWAIFHVYMKPPLYGAEMFEHFEHICFLMVTGKALFGTVFYATLGGTRPDVTGYIDVASITRPHVLPMLLLTLLLCLFIVSINLRSVYRNFTPWGREAQLQDYIQEQEQLIVNSPRFQGETGKLKRAISSPRGLSGQDSMGKLRIPRFSQALEADAIVNDGDDYHMDEHEDMEAVQLSFMAKILEDHTNHTKPFDEYAFAKKVYDSVKSPLLHADWCLKNCEGEVKQWSAYTTAPPQEVHDVVDGLTKLHEDGSITMDGLGDAMRSIIAAKPIPPEQPERQP